jgi:hypothetical protein
MRQFITIDEGNLAIEVLGGANNNVWVQQKRPFGNEGDAKILLTQEQLEKILEAIK